MNKRIKKKQIKMKNKKLCKRYPFIAIRNWRTDEPIKGYWFTHLDDMPDGWRAVFGIQMCEEIREALIKGDYLDEYRVTQIKEKHGRLCWYSNGVPELIYYELADIIYKYERMSERICIRCGRPATKRSLGWISPWCDRCANKFSNRISFEDIKE